MLPLYHCSFLRLCLGDGDNVLLTPDGGMWNTLRINGKKWIIANTTNKVSEQSRKRPTMFVVFNNKTVYGDTSVTGNPSSARTITINIPQQVKIKDINDNNNAVENGADLDSEEELIVSDILSSLRLLKEQEKLALIGPENNIGLQRIDNSVRVIMVDKMKDKPMMKKLEDLEDAEMIILDDGEWSPLFTGSENDRVINSSRTENKRRKQKNTKNKTTRRKVKRRRRQRVKIKRGYGDKVQSVYIAY